MFDPSPLPRLFALPPGVDFPAALVEGLRGRMADAPPERMARITLIVNTRRMARRIRALFDQGPPGFLPRITLIAGYGMDHPMPGLPPPAPKLRRRLELIGLVRGLLERQPDLAARASLYDLADSLADLMEEMHGEGVSAQAIRALDVADMSGHWARAQAFFNIAEGFVAENGGQPDQAAYHRASIEALAAAWQEKPPTDPVIVAGSTGSRGTTQLLMQAVAKLPQGAVVLPGYDFGMPRDVWAHLDHALHAEDHPQYRYRALMQQLDLTPDDIQPWTKTAPPSPARNQVISLALRPAPVTDAWLRDGPLLPDLRQATGSVTLIEAETPRQEAISIALRLRQAIADGVTVALITPDRMLTRQVTAALDRWDILPDDSAGLPLHLSPPGRFLRHVAELFAQRLDGELLLTLLKHPLTCSAQGRGEHLLHTRDLELSLRRFGPPFPEADTLTQTAAKQQNPPSEAWVSWVNRCFCAIFHPSPRSLTGWVKTLRNLAEAIAAGPHSTGSGGLWDKNAGQKADALLLELAGESELAGEMSAQDFASLLSALLTGDEVRDRDDPRADVMIWGTLEARVQGADLVILAGLNEGSWPEAARPDPWLNREMRHKAGLLLPERRIGLAAHDFQQAVAAREVWLTRAKRSDDAETVPSRWINRLFSLMDGLPDRHGAEALAEMRARGAGWQAWAQELEDVPEAAPAPRPSPCPPVDARPRTLALTDIKHLIRDPYAIYAKHVLRLRPLNGLVQSPDPLLRGTVFHEVFERFIRDVTDQQLPLSQPALMDLARGILQAEVPWPTARTLWMARMARLADWFLRTEADRQGKATPTAFEKSGKLTSSDPDFTLKGRADRIDTCPDGTVRLYDYKTGQPPTKPQQLHFDKQLLLGAAMVEAGAFGPEAPVSGASFIGLGPTPREVEAPLNEEPAQKVWQELRALMRLYYAVDQGFTARRAAFKDVETGDYDHLARFGEWDSITPAVPVMLT